MPSRQLWCRLRSMKVVFLKHVPGTAKNGDVKEVSAGYATNFLFPRALAKPATPEAIGALLAQAKKKDTIKQRDIKGQKRTHRILDGNKLSIADKANEAGVLYAAVTASRIAGGIEREYGVALNESAILIYEPIKHIGVYRVELVLSPLKKTYIQVHVSAL